MLTIRAPAFSLEGRARILYDLARMERARHANVLDALERILGAVPLTPEQAREVAAEMAVRRQAVQDMRRACKAADNAVQRGRAQDRRAAARPVA